MDEDSFDEELYNPLSSKGEIGKVPSIIRLGFCKEGFSIHAVGIKNKNNTFDVFLDEEDDNFLIDSKMSRGEVEGTYIFSVPDSSSAFRVFHEWVMKIYSPYSSNLSGKGN